MWSILIFYIRHFWRCLVTSWCVIISHISHQVTNSPTETNNLNVFLWDLFCMCSSSAFSVWNQVWKTCFLYSWSSAIYECKACTSIPIHLPSVVWCMHLAHSFLFEACAPEIWKLGRVALRRCRALLRTEIHRFWKCYQRCLVMCNVYVKCFNSFLELINWCFCWCYRWGLHNVSLWRYTLIEVCLPLLGCLYWGLPPLRSTPVQVYPCWGVHVQLYLQWGLSLLKSTSIEIFMHIYLHCGLHQLFAVVFRWNSV